MASKHLIPTEISSDDDEEVKTSSEEEEDQRSDDSSSEEDEDEPIKNTNTKTLVVDATAKTNRAMKEVSGGSVEEDQRSDDSTSEEEEDEPTKNKNTQTHLVVDATPKTKRAMKEVSGEAQTSTKKRQREETLTEADMTAKSSKKKAIVQWSGEDVILVLQGMINFKAEKGIVASDDKYGFYEFVKGSLSIDVSSYKFIEKMRTLKKTFMNKVKTGKEPSSSKPHDKKVFDLSKSIWGNEVESSVRRSERIINLEEEKKQVMINHEGEGDWFERSFLVGHIVSLGVDEEVVKRRWSLVPLETKKDLKRKWEAFHKKQLEFAAQKTEVLHGVVSMMVKASNPN